MALCFQTVLTALKQSFSQTPIELGDCICSLFAFENLPHYTLSHLLYSVPRNKFLDQILTALNEYSGTEMSVFLLPDNEAFVFVSLIVLVSKKIRARGVLKMGAF